MYRDYRYYTLHVGLDIWASRVILESSNLPKFNLTSICTIIDKIPFSIYYEYQLYIIFIPYYHIIISAYHTIVLVWILPSIKHKAWYWVLSVSFNISICIYGIYVNVYEGLKCCPVLSVLNCKLSSNMQQNQQKPQHHTTSHQKHLQATPHHTHTEHTFTKHTGQSTVSSLASHSSSQMYLTLPWLSLLLYYYSWWWL